MCDRVTNFISTALTMKIILITISHHQAFYCWSSSWKFLIAIIKILGGKWSLTKKPAATNSQSLITEFVSWPSRRLSSVQNNGNQWIDNDYQMKHGIGFVVFFLVISTVKPWSKSPWFMMAKEVIEKKQECLKYLWLPAHFQVTRSSTHRRAAAQDGGVFPTPDNHFFASDTWYSRVFFVSDKKKLLFCFWKTWW